MARGTTDNVEPRERRVRDNLALMRRYFDLLYTKDLDALLELVDDDIQWLVVPTGNVINGKASLAELAANHWGASPDRTKRLLNLFATEDQACMEYTSGGTLTGEVDFRSIKIPPSGRTYEIQCCFVFHFNNGKVDRVHEYFDMDTVKRLTRSAATAGQQKPLISRVARTSHRWSTGGPGSPDRRPAGVGSIPNRSPQATVVAGTGPPLSRPPDR